VPPTLRPLEGEEDVDTEGRVYAKREEETAEREEETDTEEAVSLDGDSTINREEDTN